MVDASAKEALVDATINAGADEGPIQGQLLRLSERREVAIYLRGGKLWVADFVDEHGELFDPITWFRFNCGAPLSRQAERRVVLESAFPLSPELAARIERLHRGVDAASAKERGR